MHCATFAACPHNLDRIVENEEWTRGLKIFRDLFFCYAKEYDYYYYYYFFFFIVHQDDEKQ